ncbi:MAG: flagellar hook basal-body protein [Polyangiaceae bacterium]
MTEGIYVALSGALAQAISLEATAGNLANAGTDGFQRTLPRFREELSRAGSGEPASHYASVGGTSLDTTQGALRPTGRALDVAMPAGTYLAVSTTAGERYTRAGSLSVGVDGMLRTAGGATVLGEDGQGISVPGDASAARIDADGQVYAGAQPAGRLRLVSFASPSELAHDQGALLMSTPAAGAISASRGPLVPGQVEGSNANVVTAMTDLVTATRTFEAFQRVIDTFRDEDRRVVTTVPDVPQ